MKVRFSPEVFRFQRHGGVSRYFAELHRGLLAHDVDSAVVAPLHINAHLAGLPHVVGWDVSGIGPARLRQAVTKVADPALASAWRATLDPRTIYHNTWYAETIPTRPRLVTTVFDLIHERYPDQVVAGAREARRKRRWCMAADLVLAISETTKTDLLERVPIDPGRVAVTPLGVRAVTPDPAVRPPAGPFVLYVGDRRSPYKNFDALLDAMTRSGLARDVRIVCFGLPFTPDEHARFGALARGAGIEAVGGDDAALAAYYAAASAYVCPSRYEGFGLPAVEAMAQGCPLVVSAAGSLPEVVGDAGVFFDPDDPESCADAIRRVLDDGALRADLVERGRARARGFTWEATVEHTLAAYRSI